MKGGQCVFFLLFTFMIIIVVGLLVFHYLDTRAGCMSIRFIKVEI